MCFRSQVPAQPRECTDPFFFAQLVFFLLSGKKRRHNQKKKENKRIFSFPPSPQISLVENSAIGSLSVFFPRFITSVSDTESGDLERGNVKKQTTNTAAVGVLLDKSFVSPFFVCFLSRQNPSSLPLFCPLFFFPLLSEPKSRASVALAISLFSIPSPHAADGARSIALGRWELGSEQVKKRGKEQAIQSSSQSFESIVSRFFARAFFDRRIPPWPPWSWMPRLRAFRAPMEVRICH